MRKLTVPQVIPLKPLPQQRL